MKRRLLASLFAGSKTVAPEVLEVLEELDELAGKWPSLAEPIAVLREVLPVMYQASPSETVTLTQCAAVEKLRKGTPLLRGELLSIDTHQLRHRWRTICSAVRRHQRSPSAAELVTLWDQQGWSVEQLVMDVLAGNIDHIRARAESAGLDAELTATVLRLTLFPTLSHVAAAIAPWWSTVRWAHGSCPTCGSWPLLAEFRGLEQMRFLRCGLCAAEWEFPRLACPFCATRDHKLLGYFHVEGEEAKYRAATCDSCGGYVKTVSTLASLSGPQLLVMDLATMHLDLAAVDRGYSPVWSKNSANH